MFLNSSHILPATAWADSNSSKICDKSIISQALWWRTLLAVHLIILEETCTSLGGDHKEGQIFLYFREIFKWENLVASVCEVKKFSITSKIPLLCQSLEHASWWKLFQLPRVFLYCVYVVQCWNNMCIFTNSL